MVLLLFPFIGFLVVTCKMKVIAKKISISEKEKTLQEREKDTSSEHGNAQKEKVL